MEDEEWVVEGTLLSATPPEVSPNNLADWIHSTWVVEDSQKEQEILQQILVNKRLEQEWSTEVEPTDTARATWFDVTSFPIREYDEGWLHDVPRLVWELSWYPDTGHVRLTGERMRQTLHVQEHGWEEQDQQDERRDFGLVGNARDVACAWMVYSDGGFVPGSNVGAAAFAIIKISDKRQAEQLLREIAFTDRIFLKYCKSAFEAEVIAFERAIQFMSEFFGNGQ